VNEKLEKSAANIARVGCIRVAGLNVYDILRHDKLVLTKDAVVALEGRLNPPPGEEAK
jgi:large subunit ribosomal protein L4